MLFDEIISIFHRSIMLPIFQRLPTNDLANCALACKSWNKIIQDPSLWNTVRFENWKITSHILSLIGKLKIWFFLNFLIISRIDATVLVFLISTLQHYLFVGWAI